MRTTPPILTIVHEDPSMKTQVYRNGASTKTWDSALTHYSKRNPGRHLIKLGKNKYLSKKKKVRGDLMSFVNLKLASVKDMTKTPYSIYAEIFEHLGTKNFNKLFSWTYSKGKTGRLAFR